MSDLRPIVRLDLELGKVAPGPYPKFSWLKLTQLFVDETYQRDIGSNGRGNVKRIGHEFRWTRFSPLVVATRGKDRYVIIDGQHRATAAASLGIPNVPCLIIDCDKAEEAKAFASINGNVTDLKGLQVYYAELAAGEPVAIELDQVCKRSGVVIPRKSAALTPGVTLAIMSLKRALATHGAEILEIALSIVTKTGDGNPGLLREGVIAGGCDVFKANPLWRGKNVLSAASEAGGVRALYQQALKLAATPEFNVRSGYASALAKRLRAELGDGGKIVQEKKAIASKRSSAPVKDMHKDAIDREQAVIRASRSSGSGPKPRAILVVSEKDLIAQHLATKGVRKFDSGATGEPTHLVEWLRRECKRDVKRITGAGKGHKPFEVDGKRVTAETFIAIVNAERKKRKLEPLTVREAA